MRSCFSCTPMGMQKRKSVVVVSEIVLSKALLYIIYVIKLSQHRLNGFLCRKLSQCMTQTFLWCMLMQGGEFSIAAPVLEGALSQTWFLIS